MADRVTVIGWDGSPLTRAATAALSAATLVAGAAHHLALPEVPEAAERIRLGSVDLAARRIAGHRGSAVVLADGDPGFFGVVRTLRAPEHGLEVEVVPAVSAVATAFARAGMPWDDAQIVVAHPRTLRRAVNVCRAHHKVAVLTSPGAGPAELALLLEGVHRTFVICEELGTDRERVTVLTSDKAADHAWRDPNVVIVVGGAGPETATTAPAAWIAGRRPAQPPASGAGPCPRGLPGGGGRRRTGVRRGGVPAAARRPAGRPRPPHRRPGLGHRFRQRRPRRRSGPLRGGRAGGGRRPGSLLPYGRRRPRLRRPPPDRLRPGPAGPGTAARTRCRTGRGGGVQVVRAVVDRRPERIVTHASTRDEAEALGAALTGNGYTTECSLLQSVDLDTEVWTERERSVVFLLSARRSDLAP